MFLSCLQDLKISVSFSFFCFFFLAKLRPKITNIFTLFFSFPLLFSHTIHPKHSLSSFSSSHQPPHPFSPKSIAPLLPFRKEQASQEYQMEYDTVRCYKTKHIPSHHGWTRQPSMRKRIPQAGQRQPPSHCWEFNKTCSIFTQ